jgi:hypothetical protein
MDQLLTRTLAIKENMDPRGNKWGIGKVKGTSLFHISVLEGKVRVPEELCGKYTNAVLAQKEIEKYLNEVWNANDAVVAKNNRKQD